MKCTGNAQIFFYETWEKSTYSLPPIVKHKFSVAAINVLFQSLKIAKEIYSKAFWYSCLGKTKNFLPNLCGNPGYFLKTILTFSFQCLRTFHIYNAFQ